jgi:hypothetical protein
LQAEDDGRDPGSTEAPAAPAERVLAHTDDVEIGRDGLLIATLTQHKSTEQFCQNGVEWLRHKYGGLTWSQAATMMALTGHSIGLLLYPYMLLRGKQRMTYSPRPGLDDVEVAEVLANPAGLSPLDLFKIFVSK